MTLVLELSPPVTELAAPAAAPVTIQRRLCTPTAGCPLAPGSEYCPDDTSGCNEC